MPHLMMLRIFYIRHPIPNYQPVFNGKLINGVWSNELGDTTFYDYSIAPPEGWLDANLSENGTPLKYLKIK